MKMRKKKNDSMKMSIDWSGFPPELLEIIASKLKVYIDYVRFRAVCVKWGSSVSPKPHHLPTQLPWLLFPFSSDTGTDCSFLDISTNKFHHLNLTESRDSRCCGSSQGWLVFVEECTPTIRLINPLTRDVIHLPPVTAFPNVLQFNRSKLGKEYLLQSSWDGHRYSLSMKDMRDLFIKKVVLSSNPNSLENDYIALVILNDNGDLAFHKKGVEEWSIIEETGYYNEDAIYYNGSFYAINEAGSVAICDLSGVSPIVTMVTLSPIADHSVDYLVDSFGELLSVTRHIEIVDREFDSDNDYDYDSVYETVDSKVFKYDSSKTKWVQMDTLGDNMLFLGGSSSVCLSASNFSGCEKNCIYFSSENHKDLVHGHHDCVVHQLDDDIIVPLPCADISSRHILHLPIWITPNPC